MATLGRIREAIDRQPLPELAMRLTDDQRYQVRNADSIAVREHPLGRVLTIHDQGTH